MPTEQNGSLQSQNLSEQLANLLTKNDPSTKMQAHGLTVGQMKELQKKQETGDIDMIKANIDPAYKIPEHEKHLLHYTTDEDLWDKGTKLSKPVLRSTYVEDFVRMSETEVVKRDDGTSKFPENAFRGLLVKIVHNPRRNSNASESTMAVAKPKANSSKKPLKELSEKELRAEYKRVIGEDASQEDSPVQMIAVIEEKLA